MRAMLLERCGPLAHYPNPLTASDWPLPVPRADELLIRVHACGVCHTELDIIEGRTPPPSLPVIPGHQVAGVVAGFGADVRHWAIGDRVGVAWIFSACGDCGFCRSGRENLCCEFRATGRDVPGGYAEFMTAPAAFAHHLAPEFDDVTVAPLLCAGAVGYRALRLTGIADGQRLGFMGFGASAHLILQLARRQFPASNFYVFARSPGERTFARELGAYWSGDILDRPPVTLHAIIDTTPVWLPMIGALQCLEPGGCVVINAIRKEDHDKTELLRLDYGAHLWQEKVVRSVANVTRADVRDFLALAAGMALKPEITVYPLEDANRALRDLREKHVRGAKVLVTAHAAQGTNR
jgi:propanol-preferring alcohol dehydrogenase